MRSLLVGLVLALALAAPAAGQAPHSDNVSLLANWTPGADYQGSDLAFWGNLAVLGEYGGPGGFELVDIADPAHPKKVGSFNCPGPQSDVSIWGDLVIVSVDSARGNVDDEGQPIKPDACGAITARPD